MKNLTVGTEASRKKRAVISHQDIIDYYVANPKADSWQIADRFGCSHRAAQQHLKRIRKALE